MLKKIFIDLCNAKKVSPSSVCQKVGLSTATFSCWTDESVPRRATLQRIADYFGVTVDYLLGNEAPAPDTAPTENVVIYHRDGKTVTKKFSKEQMEMIAQMLDGIPEKK